MKELDLEPATTTAISIPRGRVKPLTAEMMQIAANPTNAWRNRHAFVTAELLEDRKADRRASAKRNWKKGVPSNPTT